MKRVSKQTVSPRLLAKSIGRLVTSKRAENRIIAHVDQIGPNFVRGWAADKSRPNQALRVRVYLDKALVAEGDAETPRDDLKAAGYGDGCHAYQFPAPTKALFCASMLSLTIIEGAKETTVLEMQLQDVEARPLPVLYLDASDLMEFLTHHRELSGIQRVQAGYLLSLGNAKIGQQQCKVCARFKFANFYWEIPFERFSEIMRQAGNPAEVTDVDWPDHIHSFKTSLTARSLFRPGDTLFTLGAPWALEWHNDLIRCLKYKYATNYLQIFYDMIPISVPEVVAAPLIPHFARSMASLSLYSEHVFSISKYSMEDLSATLEKVGRQAPEGSVIPMGGTINDAEKGAVRATGGLGKLGIDGAFVLCVGTLEPRKNHMLLFQVWRRLVAKHGARNVPKLVLVGRVGWYMEDFMRILQVTNYAERTIVHLAGVSNAELSQLYDNCLFTAFPSFSEGWGLPITESHTRGKVCVCSNVTSMPEAGGDHAIYVDPYDTSAAFNVCENLIFDGHTLAERETALRSTFREMSWEMASAGLRDQLTAIMGRLGDRSPEPKPLEFRRLYRFFATWVAEPDALALRVFENFLDQEDAIEFLSGWNWFDIDVNCTWACGATADLCFLPPSDPPSDLVAYVDVITPPQYHDVPCTISVDGKAVGRSAWRDMKRLVVPIADVKAGQPVRLTFAYERSCGPKGQDLRYLGIGFHALVVYPQDDHIGRLSLWEGGSLERPASDMRILDA